MSPNLTILSFLGLVVTMYNFGPHLAGIRLTRAEEAGSGLIEQITTHQYLHLGHVGNQAAMTK